VLVVAGFLVWEALASILAASLILLYVGRFAALAGGVDASFLPSFAIAAVLYWALDAAWKGTAAAVTTEAEA
jgi:hypothetical protein